MPKDILESIRLPASELQDRAPAPDFCVVVRDMFGAPGGNDSRQGLARQPREREIDDVRIAEQVIQKGPYALQGIWSPELKENYSKLHSL